MSSQPKDQKAPTPATPVVRCAIYTRKSSEEGLGQEFNSLDAQRESGEALVASQKNEGWVCLPARYDDGGFSGGNMDRPALARLLADMAGGKVDCVVVYKVDRLSRSLLDFARIMETFDRHKVSFVSVTQQFNTTHSMGRLTLNILLSFAQFEREIIGERVRDKISAQRRKGKWTGGVAVLGYDVDRSGPSPKLRVNAQEAARVREVFSLYLEHGSLLPVVQELARRGWKTKRRVTRGGRSAGKAAGGVPFDKCNLYGLLTNPLYAGRIRHKGELFNGEHEAIVDPGVFEKVQPTLRGNGRTGGSQARNRHGALLRRLLHCKSCGQAMLALVVAMELRERLAVLRLASAFGTHGAGLCRLTFGPLMQAAYLAGRDRGRWEVGAAHLPEAERHSRKVVTADPDLGRDLNEVAECVSLGTDQIAKVVREAAGEEHAVEVLTKWEGYGRFCRDTMGMEPLTVMRAWGLMDDDPAEVVRQVCPEARADEVQAEERSAAMSRWWVERFG